MKHEMASASHGQQTPQADRCCDEDLQGLQDRTKVMKIVKCSCRMCRRGLRTKCVSQMVTKKVRAARHKAKQDLKAGKEPETKIRLPYTD
jgi:hypothetical protein